MSENNMEAGNGELDVTAGPTGVGVKTKGYKLMELVCLGSAFGVGYICLSLFNHDASGAQQNQTTVSAIKEQTAAVKESNATNRALVQAMQENNCMARLKPEQKTPDNIEFCRRIGAGRPF
jgi:hypothetical protein